MPNGRAGSWLLWCRTASKKMSELFLSSGGYSGGYPPFRVDRDRLIGHTFGSIAIRKHRTAKIMAPYYRHLFTANPMALTALSVDDLEGVISKVTKVKIERSVLTVAPRPMVPITKNVHHCAISKSAS